MSIILNHVWVLGPLLLYLQRRLSQVSEGIEIINSILPCCQSISALSSNCAYSTCSLQTEVEVIAANPSKRSLW